MTIHLHVNIQILNKCILQVMHNASPVTPINYWWNCAALVCWPWYIGSDIWFQDNFWEASLPSFHSSFSKAWSLEKVLVGIPWHVASWEMLLGFCTACFGVLFCNVVLGCRLNYGPCSQWWLFFNWGVFVCKIAYCWSVTVL